MLRMTPSPKSLILKSDSLLQEMPKPWFVSNSSVVHGSCEGFQTTLGSAKFRLFHDPEETMWLHSQPDYGGKAVLSLLFRGSSLQKPQFP